MIKVQTSESSAEPESNDSSRAQALKSGFDRAYPNRDQYTGHHLIVDLWGGEGLDDCSCLERVLRMAASQAGATLLHIHLHKFTQGGGVTGVALLAESHISVHTWPEHDFAAFDIFMCGAADPEVAAEILERELKPTRITTELLNRGRLLAD